MHFQRFILQVETNFNVTPFAGISSGTFARKSSNAISTSAAIQTWV